MKKSSFALTELHIQFCTVLGIGGAKGHMTEVAFGVASAMLMEGPGCRGVITAKCRATHIWAGIVRERGEPACPMNYDLELSFNIQAIHEYCMDAIIRPLLIGYIREVAHK